eukprot:gene4982-6965_t
MENKRRLSNGNGLFEIPGVSDDEEDVPINISRKDNNNRRRRSSLGSNLSNRSVAPSPEELLRITEMYKTVIQMSSENKLNEKNSWQYDLIDHMGKLIKDESRGINFQKASCTLDASVKIYSNRVEDTYASSQRILGSLSRNGASNDDDNPDSQTETKTKVGSKASSSKLNIDSTIEKNPEKLNAVKLEHDYLVDPLFHKMSKAFDEGGAKGMLMNNLRLSSTSCTLAFYCDEEKKPIENIELLLSQNDNNNTDSISSGIDMTDLLFKSGITLDNLAELSICPALDLYRQHIGIPDYGMSTALFESNKAVDLKRMSTNPSNRRNSIGQINQMKEKDASTPLPKINWDSNTSLEGSNTTPSSTIEKLQEDLENLQMIDNQDYAFINLDSLSNNNTWAGAKHWKYATRQKSKIIESVENVVITDPSDTADPTDETNQTKNATSTVLPAKKSTKKTVELIQFTLETVPESDFYTSNSKTDTTLLSLASIQKADTLQERNELLLPPDAKLEVKDLCRLYLIPSIIVLPKNNLNKSIYSTITTQTLPMNGVGNNQVFNNHSAYSMAGKMNAYQQKLSDDKIDCVWNPSMSQTENKQTGLEINQNNLLQAKRVVEKIDIGFAKVSKKVNIHRLKTDIWKNIQYNLALNDVENAHPNKAIANKPKNGLKTTDDSKSLSFRDMISDLSVNSRQKDNLTINGQMDMSDLKISTNQ